MSLDITNVYVNKVDLKPNIVGFAKITISDCFVVDGIKIINGKNGLFIGMPSRKNKKEEYQDICYPVTKEAREFIQEKVLDKYNDGDAGSSSSSSSSSKKSDDIFDS